MFSSFTSTWLIYSPPLQYYRILYLSIYLPLPNSFIFVHDFVFTVLFIFFFPFFFQVEGLPFCKTGLVVMNCQLLFILGSLYSSFRKSILLDTLFLVGTYFFQHFEYIIPLLSGLSARFLLRNLLIVLG